MSHRHYELLFPEQINAGRYHYLLYFHDRVLGHRVVTPHRSAWDDDDHSVALFYFEEGNAGCDCNRSLWMYDDGMPEGAPLDECGECYPCSDDHPLYPDNKIIIERIICLETGETIARDI